MTGLDWNSVAKLMAEAAFKACTDLRSFSQEMESYLIREALEACEGNLSVSSRCLRIHRNVLAQKLKKLNINPNEYRKSPRPNLKGKDPDAV